MDSELKKEWDRADEIWALANKAKGTMSLADRLASFLESRGRVSLNLRDYIGDTSIDVDLADVKAVIERRIVTEKAKAAEALAEITALTDDIRHTPR